ncbi:MAG: hypothetical protein ABIH35_03305 [Patescibacteria group bacterium]
MKRFLKILAVVVLALLVVAPPAFAGGETKFLRLGDGMVVVADFEKGRFAVFSEEEFERMKFYSLEEFRKGWKEIPGGRKMYLPKGREMTGFSVIPGFIAVRERKKGEPFTLIFFYTTTANKKFVLVRQITFGNGNSEFKNGKIEFKKGKEQHSITATSEGYLWEARLPTISGKETLIFTRRESVGLKVE